MQRPQFIARIKEAFTVNPVVALLGPRQAGKTTIANMIFAENAGNPQNYFDLENITDVERLQKPLLALEPLEGLIIIDEVQRIPELFSTLRVVVDRFREEQRYLILGSASRELLKQSSETLAGRISYIELTPFSYGEVGNLPKLWLRGGFPRSYLAENDHISMLWRKDYIRTFLEQDIPNLGITIIPENLRRLWMMLAHYHGNLLNASELGKSLNLSHNTIKNYLDILSGTFMIRQLQPWFENISKRQVKSPKIYFRDSGILHAMLNIPDQSALLTHPKLGSSWEGLALEQVILHSNARSEDCYFWATHQQAELDLMIIDGMSRKGFEFKYTDVPRATKSMYIALNDLHLDELTVIYPGNKTFWLDQQIKAIGLVDYLQGA